MSAQILLENQEQLREIAEWVYMFEPSFVVYIVITIFVILRIRIINAIINVPLEKFCENYQQLIFAFTPTLISILAFKIVLLLSNSFWNQVLMKPWIIQSLEGAEVIYFCINAVLIVFLGYYYTKYYKLSWVKSNLTLSFWYLVYIFTRMNFTFDFTTLIGEQLAIIADPLQFHLPVCILYSIVLIYNYVVLWIIYMIFFANIWKMYPWMKKTVRILESYNLL